MRRQFVLDKKTEELLEELAADRAGNRSHVVREAIQLYAEMEARLDQIEADPECRRRMEAADEDIRAGRVTYHKNVKKRFQAKKRRS